MPTTHEIAFALFGAYRLARLDPSGIGYFDRSAEGALRSFFAAVIVLPAYLLLAVLRLWEHLDEISVLRFVLVEGISYVISWTAYALAMFYIAGFLERERNYSTFLCAYNWSAVLQMALYLPAVLFGELGILPDGFGQILVLLVTFVILGYQWYISKLTLDLAASTAIGLVILDLILSVFISGIADEMLCLGADGLSC